MFSMKFTYNHVVYCSHESETYLNIWQGLNLVKAPRTISVYNYNVRH